MEIKSFVRYETGEGIEKEETDFIDKKIISLTDLEKYKRFYKYMPNFYDVRL